MVEVVEVTGTVCSMSRPAALSERKSQKDMLEEWEDLRHKPAICVSFPVYFITRVHLILSFFSLALLPQLLTCPR